MSMEPPLRLHDEQWVDDRQTQGRITAVHPDHGTVGHLDYRAHRGQLSVRRLAVTRGGRDTGEALLDRMVELHPKVRFPTGGRTAALRPFLGEVADEVQGRALHRLSHLPEMIQGDDAHQLFAEHGIHLHEEDPWEAGEVDDDHLTRGDTGASVHHPADRELHTSQNYLSRSGLEHFIRHPWDGSHGDGPRDERPSTWEHEGQHWINGGHHRLLADRMTYRRGTTVSDRTARTAARRPFEHEAGRGDPDQRIFGPTFGLDKRLWSGETLKPAVRDWVLATLDGFWRPLYGPQWRSWTTAVAFCGSEASTWTSESLEGNGDFDNLLNIDHDRLRQTAPGFIGMTDEEIDRDLNASFQRDLIPHTTGITIPVDGEQTGPWDVTFFVAKPIASIKPYAAYELLTDTWLVKPPTLPDWNIESFPQGHPLVQEIHAVAAEIRAVLKMPEPYRSQQGDRLWHYIHDGRSQAFSDQGEGWWDGANAIEKAMDQMDLWDPLVEIHFAAHDDPHLLDAPADWSNEPAQVS